MDGRLKIHCGDCLEILPTLEAGSVQTCCTSPPYWGLRDYGVDGQLGLEATPEEYIAKMVRVFREVKRVLRDDATLWLNMGDSYVSTTCLKDNHSMVDTRGRGINGSHKGFITSSPGLKPKDLCMMPARLALALQADGWYLRSEIVWHKPNPMPESVTDRPTKAHEMIYLLAKQERYFYDAEAIKEKAETVPHNSGYVNGAAYAVGPMDRGGYSQREDPERIWALKGNRNKRSVWTIPTQPYAEAHFATFPEQIPKLCILAGSKPGDTVLDPFAGSGTTGKVALELGRKAVLIELNPEYVRLIKVYTAVTVGWF